MAHNPSLWKDFLKPREVARESKKKFCATARFIFDFSAAAKLR
jgi:hypothetical protein